MSLTQSERKSPEHVPETGTNTPFSGLVGPEDNRRVAGVWDRLQQEAAESSRREPMLGELLRNCVLECADLEEALSHRLARKLGHHAVSEDNLQQVFAEAMREQPLIVARAAIDILVIKERDPAIDDFLTAFLYLKGFQAITSYRVAHHLWTNGRKDLAVYLQSLISEVFQVDIHPAARIGAGVLIDHATSVVIGETAVVEDNVSMLHEVTLGGTGKEHGDRHPKVRRGVLIGAGTKILGNIEIGACSKIGAGSVVLESIPPYSTAVGVPARVIGKVSEENPALSMDQSVRCRGVDTFPTL